MRPYLAIIKDSFRAAMASRVLYVLLLLITILLIALAPLQMRETLDWKLNSDTNVRNPERVLRQIVNGKDSKPSSRVWELLSENSKSKMEKMIGRAENKGAGGEQKQSIEEIFLQQEMIKELNELMGNPDFYRAKDWEGRSLPAEANELIDSGVDQLSDIRSKRLNRLLLSNAFPAIDQGKGSAVKFKYAVWEFPESLPMTHKQFAQFLITTLPWYFEKLVLSVGLLIAIIVTSNMIPDTFEPGSLNLLLSKPISRWGLFVSKFFGGCVFIALCSAYLFLGLWLWLGLAMDVWDRAILISIPLYVLVFAIYFSVSSVVGLVWRSATVSVILTLAFWAFCFAIGTVYYRFDTKMQNSELIDVLAIDEQVYPSDILHQLLAWDAPSSQWERLPNAEAGLGEESKIQFAINSFIIPLRDVPAMRGLSSRIAPIYDKDAARVFTSRYESGRSVTSGRKRMLVAETGGKLKFKEFGDYPNDTMKLFDTKNGVMAVTSEGYFYQLNSDKLDSLLVKTPLPDGDAPTEELPDSSSTVVAKKQESAEPKKREPVLWNRAGPSRSLPVTSSNDVDYSSSRDEFAFYSRGVLNVFASQDVSEKPESQNGQVVAESPDSSPSVAGRYDLRATLALSLEFDKGMTSRLAFAGDTILIGFGNGKVITVDAKTMQEKNEYQLEKRSAIDSVSASKNGRYLAALYRNGNLWVLDNQADAQMQKAAVVGQGKVCAFDLGAEGQLWVVDHTDRVTGYDLDNDEMIERFIPSGGWVEKIYRYALRPIYVACPKPGEFYKVVAHLSSSGNTKSNEDVDLNSTIESDDPWSPLWSGLAFMFTMLAIGCLVFQFRDY